MCYDILPGRIARHARIDLKSTSVGIIEAYQRTGTGCTGKGHTDVERRNFITGNDRKIPMFSGIQVQLLRSIREIAQDVSFMGPRLHTAIRHDRDCRENRGDNNND